MSIFPQSPRRPLATAALACGVVGAGLLAAPPWRVRGYRGLRQARFAPPTWAYAPAWTAIEVALADSTVRLLDADGPDRDRALRAAAANDALYVAFPVVYFRLRSPILAAAVTWAQFGVAAAQAVWTRRADPVAARGIYPQLAWLCLAAPAGTVQALANPDPLLKTGAPFPRLGSPRS
jgi:tryptophan-rich sensory protein